MHVGVRMCVHVCVCVHACAHTCVLKMIIYEELCTFLSLPERPSDPNHTGLCLLSCLLFSLPLQRSHRARATGPEGKRKQGWKAAIGQGDGGAGRSESQGRMPQCGRCYLSSCRRALTGSKGARRVTPAPSVPPKEHSSDSAALWPHFPLHPGCSA